MMKILSIIIPTYNMQAYLRRCLDSLLVSPEEMEMLEVLVMNDGSKDNSSQIAHEYENKYPHTFRVIDKENGNYGSCVNRGLKEASGKYVKILDADDYFNTPAFENYLKKMATLDVDLILSNMVKISPEGKIIQQTKFKIQPNQIFDFEIFSKSNWNTHLDMHGLAYKRENLLAMNYTQTEGISYTDVEWVIIPMCSVNTVYYIDETVYYYLVGREGQTMDVAVEKKCMPHNITVIYKLIQNLSKAKTQKHLDFYQNKLMQRLGYIYRFFLIKYKNLDNSILMDLDSKLQNIAPEIYTMMENSIPMGFDTSHIPFIRYWHQHGRKKLPASLLLWNKICRRIKHPMRSIKNFISQNSSKN